MIVGDRVKIIGGPMDKYGKTGTIHSLATNGAFVKLDDPENPNRPFTPVQFFHLQKIRGHENPSQN